MHQRTKQQMPQIIRHQIHLTQLIHQIHLIQQMQLILQIQAAIVALKKSADNCSPVCLDRIHINER